MDAHQRRDREAPGIDPLDRAEPRRDRCARRALRSVRVALALTLVTSGALAQSAAPEAVRQAPEALRLASDAWRRAIERRARDAESADAGTRAAALDDLAWTYERFAPRALAGDELHRDELRGALLATIALAQAPEGARPPSLASTDLLLAARAIAERYGDAEYRANVELRIAQAEWNRGRLREARERLLRAVDELPTARGMRPFLEVEIADLCRHRGDLLEAEWWAQQAECDLLPGFARHDAARCEILGVRGQTALALGLPDRAALLFAAERALARQIDDWNAWTAHLQRRARLDLATERYDKIEKELTKFTGTPSFRECEPLLQAKFWMLLGRAQAALERADAAREPQAAETLARALAEPELPVNDRLAAELALARNALSARRLDDARARIDLARAQADTADFAERTQQVAFLAALEARVALDEGVCTPLLRERWRALEPAYRALLASWRALPFRAGGVAFLEYGDRRQIVSTCIAVRARLDGAEAALAELVEAQACSSLYRQITRDAPPRCDVASIQRDVATPSGALLVLFVAPDQSHVFVVDDGGVAHARAPGEARIDALERELAARRPPEVLASAQAWDDESLACGRALAAAVLPATIRARLERSARWTIAGAEILDAVPFDALPGETPETPETLGALGLRRPIAHVPSIPIALALAHRRASKSGGLDLRLIVSPDVTLPADALLAPGETGASAPPLPARAHEALTRGFGARTEVWSAPRRTLADAVAPGARVWSFLAHGVYDVARERPAGLRLSTANGIANLWCDDVERLAAPPLVLLGTCGAARGPERKGSDGISHLGGAFLCAGAHAVVLTRFDVHLQATIDVLARVHDEIARGAAPAEALWRARRALHERGGDATGLLLSCSGLGYRPVFD